MFWTFQKDVNKREIVENHIMGKWMDEMHQEFFFEFLLFLLLENILKIKVKNRIW
jgi:hypothetical protein